MTAREPSWQDRSSDYREGFSSALKWVLARFNLDFEDELALKEAIETGPWE